MSIDIKRHVVEKHLFDRSLMETKKHGTEELPVQFYEGAFIGFDEFSTHWHREIEMIKVISGEMIVKMNHQPFEVKKDDYVFISKGTLHSIHKSPTTKETVRFQTLIFDLYLLSSVLREYSQKQIIEKVDKNALILNCIVSKESPQYEIVDQTFKTIKKTYDERKPHYEVMIKGLLHVLMFYILNENSNLSQSLKQRPKINISKAIDVITTNIGNTYTIAELASTVCYSEAYFMREFKKSMGMTVTEFINKERIKQAKVLLSNTDENIAMIAVKCGYNNISYFNKCFKKEMNQTPFEYRKHHRN